MLSHLMLSSATMLQNHSAHGQFVLLVAGGLAAPHGPEPETKSSSWCNSVWKRGLDLFWSVVLLLAFSPLLLLVALAVKISSRGPVFFRQRRPGKAAREFTILKFRTMFTGPERPGLAITRALDPRITWLGLHMRRWKLDELPQLFNVLRGEMSFVGPRPLPTRHWHDPANKEDAAIVLSVRPGITSHATLMFRNEEEVLASVPAHEVEKVYRRTLMPLKHKLEIEYLNRATFLTDAQIVLRTVGRIFGRKNEADGDLREFFRLARSSQATPHSTNGLPKSSSNGDALPGLHAKASLNGHGATQEQSTGAHP